MTISNTEIIDALQKIDSNTLNGVNHKRNAFIHRLFQYPAMMIPLSQDAVVGVMSKFLSSDAKMIDPFMGSATSIVISMKHGFYCYGQDINPLAVLLSKVKTECFDVKKLNQAYNEIALLVEEDKYWRTEVKFPNVDKWFSKRIKKELSKIRRAITQIGDIHIRRFFWIVLAETVRLTSNDRTSTFKLHQRKIVEIAEREISAIKEFFRIAQRSIEDITLFQTELKKRNLLINNYYKNGVNVKWGDTSKSIGSGIKYNLLVSSPPYGDNHTTVTYGQHAYLPLQWIDLNDIDKNIDDSFLRTTQEIDRISLGGKIEKEVISSKFGLFDKTNTLKTFYESFDEADQKKLDKSIAFINDFDQALNNILNSLEKNALLVWTIGNRHVAGKEIRNDLILRELSESKGLIFISDVERAIQGKRMPSRNNISKTMSKEKILIFRKPF